jgi:NAD(P)-dependent dehydrogenase (short-subunit alcohol dehydrogenase family)
MFDRLVEAFGRIDILVANAMRLACRQPADPQAWHRLVRGDEKRAHATVRS